MLRIVFRIEPNRVTKPNKSPETGPNHFKLVTVATNRYYTSILDRPRRQALLKPCHCLASAPIREVANDLAGRVVVYSGADGSVMLTLSGEFAYDWFGKSLAALPDMNSDGISELAVGAPVNNGNGTNAGKVYVYLLGDRDNDDVWSSCDNCNHKPNPDQTDSNSDGVGDVCLECCGQFTWGRTGNVDRSDDGKCNLADITRLIDRVYISKNDLCCEQDGNTDGDTEGKINLADITKLIDHVYIGKTPNSLCL